MRIHWFSITIHNNYEHALDMWQAFFQLELGDLVKSSRAGRGFMHIDVALHEAKLYYEPLNASLLGNKDYYHFEFSGTACDCVIPTHFRDLVRCLLDDGILFKVTRIDLAFDGVPFSPLEFYDRVVSGEVVTSAKRESLRLDRSPFDIRDDGLLGSDTCYLGSGSSDRFVRVYNKRGFTRLEFVCKDDRSQAVVLDLFDYLYGDWDVVGREHLLDYLQFPSWLEWLQFIAFANKADLVITPARKVALTKIENWLRQYVSVALSVYYDVYGWKEAQAKIDSMLFEAYGRDRSRYASILQLSQPFIDLKTLSVPETHDIDFELDDPNG